MRFGFVKRAFGMVLATSLIAALTWRDIAQRFRSSLLEPVWLVAQPLLLLALTAAAPDEGATTP